MNDKISKQEHTQKRNEILRNYKISSLGKKEMIIEFLLKNLDSKYCNKLN